MTALTTSAYALRVLGLMLRRPREAADRIRGRAELAAERRRLGAPPSLAADVAWEAQLHERLDEAWPCTVTEEFGARWQELERLLRGALPLGAGHDADPALARAVWCVVRHLKPERVVETGVARGVLTRFVLQALHDNRKGHLWSIDLPPVLPDWHAESAVAITDELRRRWTLLRGSSRRRLPALLREVGTVDLFIHDSLHTEANMRFEFAHGWAALGPGAVLVADDAHSNAAFVDFFADEGRTPALLVQEELKAGKFGIAFKAG
jgi:hypothetical protein